MLIIMSGLPGAGKSTIADELGRRLGAPVLSVDPIEAAIRRAGIPASSETGVAAYAVAAAVAEAQLRLGLTVVCDAVNAVEAARELWRRAARNADVGRHTIEVICSDTGLHQARLAARRRNLDSFDEPTWGDVVARRDEWEPWQDDRLLLDSVEDLGTNVDLALAHLTPPQRTDRSAPGCTPTPHPASGPSTE